MLLNLRGVYCVNRVGELQDTGQHFITVSSQCTCVQYTLKFLYLLRLLLFYCSKNKMSAITGVKGKPFAYKV